MHAELLAIKALVSNRSIAEAEKSPKAPARDYESFFIRSLEDRIISLERQLDQKQKIIGKLLEERRHYCGDITKMQTKDSPNLEGQKPKQQSTPNKGGAKERNKSLATQNNEMYSNNANASQITGGETATKSSVNNNSQAETECEKDKKGTKKRVVVVGDSMLNGVNEKGLSRNHFVKVYAHGGATSEDLVDHISCQ
eukprot:Seg6416.2 transcript_id=Seg6416.2/GoldUCD/mRNA.D3Y31 product="hypothetical protein" protein_id=Seg6416.2/GoldUCD/D3Y31